MKAKLLKKVRKRFEIIHMPAGFTSYGDRYEYNLYKLTDSTNSFYEQFAQLGRKAGDRQFLSDQFIFETENECVHLLKKCIIDRLRSEGYRGKKDYHIKNQHKKVWHI